ncbi:MAG: DUF3536 domain-containing protein [Thermodesulfobacteriota bacterium]
MNRHVCIHAHFYQPPRENPWLEAIELQDSSYPYHDWNERITAECYAPNAISRILDEDGRVAELVNNYARISFNFGPTLLSWLEKNALDVYQSILDADLESQRNFSGHGSALAQAYNHIIMPLAVSRDKYTQAWWGVRDFQHRFQRKPEGMWLPETAVDMETLDIMAGLGIKFTILAPRQAHRVRVLGSRNWLEVRDQGLDATIPYILFLPSGRYINLFFYDGSISQAIAFEGLLHNGEALAQRIIGAFTPGETKSRLVNIATDGETYGHHHRHGDMALAYALHCLKSKGLAEITNYGDYLSRHPPNHEVQIVENSSWSCLHGVERWRSHCGCNSGGYPQWNQSWRTPLRSALDWLRDTANPLYYTLSRKLLRDPWAARNDYCEIILDRNEKRVNQFFKKHAVGRLKESDKIVVLKLMELQRHLMLMYTSCGWFFDELSGPETVQIIQYSGRAIQLAGALFEQDLETEFLNRLELAKSNIPEHQNGKVIYGKWVKPTILDLTRVGAHYAVSSLFKEYEESISIFSFNTTKENYLCITAGRAKLAVGRARFTSRITHESSRLAFGVLHLGDHNINCGVREYQGEAKYKVLVKELKEAFDRADFAETIRLLDKHFGTATYAVASLFRDEQRKVIAEILAPAVREAETTYGHLYDHHAPLILFLKDIGLSIPTPLSMAAEFILNAKLRRAFEQGQIDDRAIQPIMEEMRQAGVAWDETTLEFALRRSLEKTAGELLDQPDDMALLERLARGVALARSMPFEVNLRKVQNIGYRVLNHLWPGLKDGTDQEEEIEQTYRTIRTRLGELLWLRLN